MPDHALDFTQFRWLSFDCYGTLVDWETGISSAVAHTLASRGIELSKQQILALFAAVEPEVQQAGEFLEYRQVLRRVMALMGQRVNVQFSEAEAHSLVDTMGSWPVFPDSVEALRLMKSHYKLAVISNVDDDLFLPSAQALGVEWDAVVTAQQCRSYKPNLNNFHIAKQRMGVEKDDWLHIAESLYHDIGPTNEMGIPSVWVNRGHANEGGATRSSAASPDMEVPSLDELLRLMRLK